MSFIYQVSDRIEKRWRNRIIFLVCAALLASVIMFLVTTTEKREVIQIMMENPSLILWNCLPAFCVVGILFFVTRRTIFSGILLQAVWLILSVADKIKVSMRQEPLLPTDLQLVKEAMSIFKTFPIWQVVLLVVCVVALILVLIFSLTKLPAAQMTWKTCGIGLLCTVLVGGIAFSTVYQNTERYDSYAVVGNPYFAVNRYNSRGLAYSFLYQISLMSVDKPEGYEEKVYDEIYETAQAKDQEKKPHIVMIMGEAYSDLSENEHISFDGLVDPMQHFKELCARENAVSGHIYVPGFGGGTSNTEYDVLTGLSTRLLRTTQPSYDFVRHEMDTIPYRLKEIGYQTIGIHPGYAWFYNRQNVYPDFGFEKTYFLEDSFDLAKQGVAGYINEEATMDKIIEVLDTQIQSSDDPTFLFTVTIQNHGPYDNKYQTIEQHFQTDVSLTKEENDLLNQYFHGMMDADRELQRLVEYADNSEEPIILVYFGDHLPGFSNGMDFFDLLDYPIDANGTPAEQMALYQTPYVIWSNDNAAKLCDVQKNIMDAKLPESGIISSFYLGALTLEIAGMEELSPLYDTLNAMRKEYPILSNMYQMTVDGAYIEQPTKEMTQYMNQLHGWEYYLLFDHKLEQ